IIYGAYFRPLLVYVNEVVNSRPSKDVTLIERVQRAATRMVAGLKSANYETRLEMLDFFPLEYRRLRGDLILTYALFDPANTRRGHNGYYTIGFADEKASYADLVTEYDRKVEEFLKSEILAVHPDHKIIAEEGYSGSAVLTQEPTWIIDPIDGTSNFVSRLRTMGSAALHICQVAGGTGDGFYEFGIHCWDYAAGLLIVREAGGFCCNYDGMSMYFLDANNSLGL
ncbi:hypothetical protein T265_13808, partial [Opisthorchis viverrini]